MSIASMWDEKLRRLRHVSGYQPSVEILIADLRELVVDALQYHRLAQLISDGEFVPRKKKR